MYMLMLLSPQEAGRGVHPHQARVRGGGNALASRLSGVTTMLRLAPLSQRTGIGVDFYSTHQQQVDEPVYTLPGVHQNSLLARPDQVAVGPL